MLLDKFEDNDREIDEMLDVIIGQLDSLKVHAMDIEVEIQKQGRILR